MEIIKGIAPPPGLGAPRTKYPWTDMAVGDCFDSPPESIHAVRSAANMARFRSKTGARYSVTLVRVGKGKTQRTVARCWRTA